MRSFQCFSFNYDGAPYRRFSHRLRIYQIQDFMTLIEDKCVESRMNVHILASKNVPFTLTTVQVPNLALTHKITVQVLYLFIHIYSISTTNFSVKRQKHFWTSGAHQYMFDVGELRTVFGYQKVLFLPPLMEIGIDEVA